MSSTPSPRPVRPPRQGRSLRTQERILAAMEALLAEGDAGEITMERLAERAHVSIGAIYKRFRGKESLLPLVFERMYDQDFQRLRAFIARPGWSDVGLAERIHALFVSLAECEAKRKLFRALLVSQLQSADQTQIEARSAEVIGAIHAWLSECSDEVRHPDPSLALSLGLFTTLQALQTAILLDRIPPALGTDRFVREMQRMFVGYLQVHGDDQGGT